MEKQPLTRDIPDIGRDADCIRMLGKDAGKDMVKMVVDRVFGNTHDARIDSIGKSLKRVYRRVGVDVFCIYGNQ